MAERRRGPDRRAKPSPGRRGRPPLDDGGASTAVSIRLSNEMYDQACAVATRKSISIPALIRDAVARFLHTEPRNSVI
jgi:hypothetical protein